MKCNKIALAAALVLGLGAAGSASADGGVITFVGSIADATCVVEGGPGTIGNGSNFTVALDNANVSDFAASRTAKPKNYSLSFSDGNGGACTGLTNGNAVVTIGNGADKTNITANGTLRNVKTGTGAATNVEFQLLDQSNNPINLITPWVGTVTGLTTQPQLLTLGVQYFQAATGTDVGAGSIESFISYDVAYN